MKKIMAILKGVNKDADFTQSDDFISDGLLDSMDLSMLAIALEDEYGIKVANKELVPQNFANLEAIKDFLRGHGVEGDL